MKKVIFSLLSIVMTISSIPTNAAWRDYVKPTITSSMMGGTAGSFYTLATGIAVGGSVAGGFVWGGVPLVLATTYNWGISPEAPVQVRNKQKRAILGSTVAIGTGVAFMGGLIKWAFPVMMGSGAPGAQPGKTLAALAGAEAATFCIGSTLASLAAYKLWKENEEANG